MMNLSVENSVDSFIFSVAWHLLLPSSETITQKREVRRDFSKFVEIYNHHTFEVSSLCQSVISVLLIKLCV